MIQHGWDVHASDGEHVGVVFLVVGDENEDIFDGLAITHHGGFAFHNYADRPHYVEASQVGEIDDSRRVSLLITAAEARQLPVHDVPGIERADRARSGITHPSPSHRDRASDRRRPHQLTRSRPRLDRFRTRRGPAGQDGCRSERRRRIDACLAPWSPPQSC